jgi:CheY-like chemotaxis protein
MTLTARQDHPAAAAQSKGTVLLVDDEPLLLRAFGRVLKQRGYTVDSVPDGETALTRIGGKKFDAMFIDLSLPGADGLTILRKVHLCDPELPIVLMTGTP